MTSLAEIDNIKQAFPYDGCVNSIAALGYLTVHSSLVLVGASQNMPLFDVHLKASRIVVSLVTTI